MHGKLSQTRSCQDLRFSKTGMPALPDHLAYSSKTQEERGFSLNSSLKFLYSSWESDLSCLQASRGFGYVCVWLAAGECISWTAWQGHLRTTSFSGTILLFIRANWQGRKGGCCVMCYWDKARQVVAIPSLIEASFWADRKDLDKIAFPAEDSVQPSLRSSPRFCCSWVLEAAFSSIHQVSSLILHCRK